MTHEYSNTGVCSSHLSKLQRCTNNDNVHTLPIYISPYIDQGAGEVKAEELETFQSILSSSEDCLERLKPFACLYLFPLDTCGRNNESVVIKPSREECVSLRESVCQKIWNLARSYLPAQLPRCDTLPVEPTLLETCRSERLC